MGKFKKIDLSKVKTVKFDDRQTKTDLGRFGRPFDPDSPFSDFLKSLPDFLRAGDILTLSERIARARLNEKSVIWMMGAHPLKVGLAPIINDLIENSSHPLIFKDLRIIELFKLYIDRKPIISFRRGTSGQYTILDKLSIGERCAVILFIMLLEKNKPLLIDQADAELDQDSIKRFSIYLLSMKKNRQIIVATHNANIPVLGDVDLLYHLNTEPSELEERELGVITNSSGFEDSIEDLLILEGGKDAIIKRFKKYDWKIL